VEDKLSMDRQSVAEESANEESRPDTEKTESSKSQGVGEGAESGPESLAQAAKRSSPLDNLFHGHKRGVTPIYGR